MIVARSPLLAACIIAAMAAPAAFAQTPPAAPDAGQRQTMRDRFEAANTTHDGHLTLAQAKAGHMPMLVKNFDAVDADHKGYVTLQDIRAFAKARREARQAVEGTATP